MISCSSYPCALPSSAALPPVQHCSALASPTVTEWAIVVQACNGLPQTGLVDDETWQTLLGPQAQPCDIDNLFSESEDDNDMLGGKGVWLLGEQRWARAPGTY